MHPEMIYSKRSMTGHRHEAMPLLLEGPTKASLGGLQYTSLAIVPVGLQAPQEAVFGQPALEVLSAHSLSSQRNYRTHLAGLYDIDRIVNMLYITIRQAPTRLPILFYEGSQKTTNQQLAILQRLESAQRRSQPICGNIQIPLQPRRISRTVSQKLDDHLALAKTQCMLLLTN